ncbi:MAG TPA: vWA domain-containing protein, partial [Armatimonadota bacterium]|nr:vWA domain-containing protein [Armatimonadota bacterium]
MAYLFRVRMGRWSMVWVMATCLSILVGTVLAGAADASTSIVFLVDTSVSMAENSRLERVGGELAHMVRRLAQWNEIQTEDRHVFEWAVISFSGHHAYLEQPFISYLDESGESAWPILQPDGDTPLVWGITQALGYLFRYGQKPYGQVMILSDGVDTCTRRAPLGGVQAIEALNKVLAQLWLPGRPTAGSGGARRTQRFGAVDLFPLGSGLPRQVAARERLGELGQTSDDELPRVQALMEESDMQVRIDVMAIAAPPGSQLAALTRSIAEAGGGKFVSAASDRDIETAMDEFLPTAEELRAGATGEGGGVVVATPGDGDPVEPAPSIRGEWRTHTDEVLGVSMRVAPGWSVGELEDDMILGLQG